MRVLLSTYDSRGGVEPLLALAVRLQELGAEAVVCAPPDCAQRLAEAGVPLVPAGDPVRQLVHGTRPPSAADVPRLAAELIAAWFDNVGAAAEDCDAVVATGLIPVVAGARSVAEKLGIPSVNVSYCPVFLPSPHHRPPSLPGRPVPAEVTDPGALDEWSVQAYNEVFGPALNEQRAANGLPPVANVRDYVIGARPWLAADPVLAPWPEPADPNVVQTGAWILPDERPLPAEVEAFLDAGPPPVYAGFGSMRASADTARAATEAIRAHGRRVLLGRGWADLALIDDQDDCLAVGEVNQQALFRRVAAVVHHGGAGTTTTVTRAGAPQVVVPQWADQPYFASRVAALGVGAAHDGQAPTTESLSAALSIALAPETRERATAVAGTIRTDGAAVAANLLLDAASRDRPSASW
ncbi:MAG TPA: glycosyltransferase [Streptosporangiaceae bacterium]|jgi:vancomycin aglycone glucosyltransferase